MTEQSARTADRANYVTADHCGNRRRALRLNSSVMQKSRDVFPVKTAHHLADVTGYSLRTAEYWLSEKVVIPSDALAALIQSEWGREFLAAVMIENTSRWWLTLKAYLKRISIEAQQARQEREYKELLREEAEARKYHATPMLQDDPFYEGLATPFSPTVRRKLK